MAVHLTLLASICEIEAREKSINSMGHRRPNLVKLCQSLFDALRAVMNASAHAQRMAALPLLATLAIPVIMFCGVSCGFSRESAAILRGRSMQRLLEQIHRQVVADGSPERQRAGPIFLTVAVRV